MTKMIEKKYLYGRVIVLFTLAGILFGYGVATLAPTFDASIILSFTLGFFLIGCALSYLYVGLIETIKAKD